MFNWFCLADRLIVGVPVAVAVIGCMLLIARAEEHARKARARARKARRIRSNEKNVDNV